MAKKSTWKKINVAGASEALSADASKAHTKQASVDELFTIDTKADLKKGASTSIRKGIQKAILAPVITGKTIAHVKLLEKTEKKLANKPDAPKRVKTASVNDVWGEDIVTGISGDKGREVPVPSSIPYAHVPSVPLPSSFEAFNPDEEQLKKVLALASTEVLNREHKEKEMVEMRRPMTHFLHKFLGKDDLKVLDDITQQRVFRAAHQKVPLEFVKAAVLRHKILGDEMPLLGMAQTGFVPENLMPFEGSLASLSGEIKPEVEGDDEVVISDSTIDLVTGLIMKEEVLSEDDEESEAEDIEDGSDAEGEKRKKSKKEVDSSLFSIKKSKHQRNKEERHKTLMAEHAERRKIKEGLSKDVPVILKELKARYKALEARATEKKALDASIKQEEATGKVFKAKKLGSQRFKEAPVAMAMPSELVEAGGSLRKMKLQSQLPVANAIAERFTSMQRRGHTTAAPDVFNVEHQYKKRKEAIVAAKARKNLSSNRLNYDESNLV